MSTKSGKEDPFLHYHLAWRPAGLMCWRPGGGHYQSSSAKPNVNAFLPAFAVYITPLTSRNGPPITGKGRIDSPLLDSKNTIDQWTTSMIAIFPSRDTQTKTPWIGRGRRVARRVTSPQPCSLVDRVTACTSHPSAGHTHIECYSSEPDILTHAASQFSKL